MVKHYLINGSIKAFVPIHLFLPTEKKTKKLVKTIAVRGRPGDIRQHYSMLKIPLEPNPDFVFKIMIEEFALRLRSPSW